MLSAAQFAARATTFSDTGEVVAFLMLIDSFDATLIVNNNDLVLRDGDFALLVIYEELLNWKIPPLAALMFIKIHHETLISNLGVEFCNNIRKQQSGLPTYIAISDMRYIKLSNTKFYDIKTGQQHNTIPCNVNGITISIQPLLQQFLERKPKCCKKG